MDYHIVIKKINILIILLIILMLNLSSCFVVLPFYYNNKISKNVNLDSISGKDFLDIFSSKMVTPISFGTPYNTIDFYITMEDKFFYIGKGYCESNSISSYNPKNSASFSNSSWFPYPFGDLRNTTIAKDKCSLFNDYNLKNNVTIDYLELLYGSLLNITSSIYYPDKICGILGLKLSLPQDLTTYNMYKSFKVISTVLKENNINSSIWTIEFFNENLKSKLKIKYDGYLIIGAEDESYLKQKNIGEDNIFNSYAQSSSNALEWIIIFSQVYYKNKTDFITVEKNPMAEISADINYISVTQEYFLAIKKDFFQPYLDKDICKLQKIKEFYLRFQFIHCDKKLFSKEIEKFPTLYMVHQGYNYTFVLTYKDLFLEFSDNRLIFMAIFDPWNPDRYKLGKLFLKKYQFMYKVDSKLISFVNKDITFPESNDNDKEKYNETTQQKRKLELKNIIWLIILIILFIGIILGIFIGKKIWEKARKKRANELMDEYEYNTLNNGINNEN